MPVPYPQPRTPGLLLYAEMPAQTSPQPDIWRWLWRIATGNALLAASLLAVILYWLILTIFPQFSSDADLLASWAAQTRFGRATGFLHRIGLFSAGNSPLIPLLLSVLGFAVLLRAFGRGEVLLRSLRNRTPPLSAIFPAIAEIGALLLLCGLLIGRVGGWRVEGLVGETGTIVPGRGLTLEMTPAGPRVQPGDARAYVVGYGPRLTLRALDAQGRELPLQRTPRESPQPSLSFCLTPRTPETSLAVSEAGLILQFQAVGALSAHPAADVTVFRAPSGEQAKTATVGDDRPTPPDGLPHRRRITEVPPGLLHPQGVQVGVVGGRADQSANLVAPLFQVRAEGPAQETGGARHQNGISHRSPFPALAAPGAPGCARRPSLWRLRCVRLQG